MPDETYSGAEAPPFQVGETEQLKPRPTKILQTSPSMSSLPFAKHSGTIHKDLPGDGATALG